MQEKSIVKILILVFCMAMVLVFCQGCQSVVSFWANNDIDTEIRDEVHSVNARIFSAVLNGDSEELEKYISKEFVAAGSSGLDIVTMFEPILVESPTIYEECYFQLRQDGNGNSEYRFSNESNYYIKMAIHEKDTYMMLLTIKDEGKEYIIKMVYTKNSNDWKLLSCDVNYFAYYEMDIKSLVEKAEQSLVAENYVSAYVYSELANSISRPFEFLFYNDISGLQTLTSRAREKLTERFPIEILVENVKVTIVSASLKEANTGIVPIFLCRLDDGQSFQGLSEEQLKEVGIRLGAIFPELTEEFSEFKFFFE